MDKEQETKTKQRVLQPLRGERPQGVEGHMKRRHLIDYLDKMQRESSLEEEERTWKELDRILREDPV